MNAELKILFVTVKRMYRGKINPTKPAVESTTNCAVVQSQPSSPSPASGSRHFTGVGMLESQTHRQNTAQPTLLPLSMPWQSNVHNIHFWTCATVITFPSDKGSEWITYLCHITSALAERWYETGLGFLCSLNAEVFRLDLISEAYFFLQNKWEPPNYLKKNKLLS